MTMETIVGDFVVVFIGFGTVVLISLGIIILVRLIFPGKGKKGD